MGFPLPEGQPGGVTPPSLENWQFSFNGLTFGAGTSFGIMSVKGLAMADVRQGDIVLPRDQGYEPGLDLFGGRTVEMDFWMTGIGGLQANQVEMATAFTLGYATEQPLWFQLPNLPLLCVMARVRKRLLPWDANFAAQAAGKPTAQWFCTDPRIYTASVATTIDLGSAGSGGLGFPVGPFPVTFGGTAPAEATIANSGNFESRPILVFNGPLTAPYCGNLSIADDLLVQLEDPYGEGGFTIAGGDQVLLDMNVPHRVLYYVGGIASGSIPSSVRDWLTFESSWWTLNPTSSGQVVQFGSQDATDTGGSVTVLSASAYEL